MKQLRVHLGNIGDEFSFDQIKDKTLIAKWKVNVRSGASMVNDKNILYRCNVGDIVGVVFSWKKVGTQVWWMLYPDNGYGYTWVLHNKNAFSVKALKDQGAKTTKEEEKEKENKEKPGITDTLMTLGKYGIIAFVGVSLIKSVLKS